LNVFLLQKAENFKKLVFHEWKIVTFIILLRKSHYNKLSNYHEKKMVYVYFTKWIRKFTESKKLKVFYKIQRLKQLKIWFDLWRKIRCRNLIFEMMTKRRNMNLIQNSFDFLKENCGQKKKKRAFYQELRRRFVLKKFTKILKKVAGSYKKIREYVIIMKFLLIWKRFY